MDEFIRQNADPVWLHQNEMWEYIEEDKAPSKIGTRKFRPEDDEVPF